MNMRRYKARFEYDAKGNRIHLVSKAGKWVKYSEVKALETTAQRLLALVEAVAVDLDPEYGPDAELLAELPKLRNALLGESVTGATPESVL